MRFAQGKDEGTPGSTGFAVPLFSDAGLPLGSLSIAMSRARYAPGEPGPGSKVLRSATESFRRQILNTLPPLGAAQAVLAAAPGPAGRGDRMAIVGKV